MMESTKLEIQNAKTESHICKGQAQAELALSSCAAYRMARIELSGATPWDLRTFAIINI
jgi:hypothetical protein